MLGVESPLVCDILASADENGLMKMSSKSDFEKMKPEMVKFTYQFTHLRKIQFWKRRDYAHMMRDAGVSQGSH